MNKLLTISIPTFNRATLLDKQIAWLAQAIKGLESECEIVISDNCSTDSTPEVIQRWQPILSRATLKLNRNSQNIGAVRNIAYCINTATGEYVWTISDDDHIHEQTLAYVLKTLSTHPDLALLILNFSKRSGKTGETKLERCFVIDDDLISSNGKAIFEQCLQERRGGGVALTTALVYRRDLAQRGVQTWTSGLDNLLVQIYWTGFCACYGSVKVTKDNYLECNSGTHHFTEARSSKLKLQLKDSPAVFIKLMELGYSQRLCQQLILGKFKRNFKQLLRSMRKQSPVITLQELNCYFGALKDTGYGILKEAFLKVTN